MSHHGLSECPKRVNSCDWANVCPWELVPSTVCRMESTLQETGSTRVSTATNLTGWEREGERAVMSEGNERYVEVNGVTLYVEEQGAGVPLLLLHGGLGSGRDWDNLIPQLAADFRVVSVDVRGHGRSSNPSGSLTYPLIAEDFARLIDVLGLARPFVAGWSDGGQHALQIGSRYPDLARGLLVGAADFRVSAESRQWVREFFGIDDRAQPDLTTLDSNLGDSAPRYHAKHPGGPEQWRRVVEQTARLWLDYEGMSDVEFGRIQAPTLVMVGDRDEDVPVEDAVAMYRAIPCAELAVCPNANHFIPWRHPDWLVGTMRAFMARVLDQQAE